MRRSSLVVALRRATLLTAGCGSSSESDDGGSGKPGGDDDGAQAFIACFKAPRYKAVKPHKGQESLFALEAARGGFANTHGQRRPRPGDNRGGVPHHLREPRQGGAGEGELGRSTVGDIPPQRRGRAVLAYAFPDDKAKTEKAIDACL